MELYQIIVVAGIVLVAAGFITSNISKRKANDIVVREPIVLPPPIAPKKKATKKAAPVAKYAAKKTAIKKVK